MLIKSILQIFTVFVIFQFSICLSVPSYEFTNNTITHEALFAIEVENFYDNGTPLRGEFTIGLFSIAAPLTVGNFLLLTNGVDVSRHGHLHYKGIIFHRIVKDFVAQTGDVMYNNGSGSVSSYGGVFRDETFFHTHKGHGWVGMANSGPDTNNSQFYITLGKPTWLDNVHVVFGKVLKGFSLIEKLNDVPVNENSYPLKRVRIVNCNARPIDKPFEYHD